MPIKTGAYQIELTPGIIAGVLYDDNILYNRESDEQIDDYGYNVKPEMQLNYIVDTFQMGGYGEIDFLQYFEEKDLNRNNQNYGGNFEYQSSERLRFLGGYDYLRDETNDSRFEATGRIRDREPVISNTASGGLQFDITELFDIRPFLTYKNVEYAEEVSVDFERYTIVVSLNKQLTNQRDTLRIAPAYSRYENEFDEISDDYRLTLGWIRRASEILSFNINLGGRYTVTENVVGEKDDGWGGVARINLNRTGETFKGQILLTNDLGVSTDGELLNVSRFFLYVDQKFTARFGFQFGGDVYYSYRERQDLEDDDNIFSFKLKPAFYYLLTEQHSITLNYEYFYQEELDLPGNPKTQRNYVGLFLNLYFPQQWDL